MHTNWKLAFLMTSVIAGGGVAAAQDATQGGSIQGAPAQGAETQGNASECPMHAHMKEEMLQKFDANHDGKLDDQERATMVQQMTDEAFKRLDTNGDGQISEQEFKAGATRKLQKLQPQPSTNQPANPPPSPQE